MIIVVAFALAIIAVPIAGGDLRRLASLPLSHSWLLFMALALQIGIIEIVPDSVPGLSVLHVCSYALAIAFLVANRRIPGMILLSLGAAANVLAITTNGGVMPASRRALELAGKAGETGHFVNSGAVDHARFAFLGDVFALPKPFPFANVFSIGDLLLVIGGALTVHAVCGSRLLLRSFDPRRYEGASAALAALQHEGRLTMELFTRLAETRSAPDVLPLNSTREGFDPSK